MLRPNTGIIKAGRDRMGDLDLSVFCLKEFRFAAMQNTDIAFSQRGRMLLRIQSVSGSLNADHLNALILKERVI